MNIRIILSFLLLLSLCGCGFAYEEHLTGNYYLIAVDVKEDLSVDYCEKEDGELDLFLGITGGGVREVGFDEQFILVKKYKELKDSLGFSRHRYDKSCLEYYIIPVDNTQRDYEAQENFFGPFNEQQFMAKRRELGVSSKIVLEKY